MTSWVVTNSLALLGIVFCCGQLVNRVKSLEKRMQEAESRESIQTEQTATLARLAEKIESLKDSLERTSNGVHDLRNTLMRWTGK